MMELSKSEYSSVQQLYDFIKKIGAFKKYEEPVKLSSGKLSNYYFNIKLVTGDAEGINLLAKVLYERIQKLGKIEAIGGLEAGSIPLATAVSQLSYLENPDKPIQSFYVRKKPKEHGLRKRIEGIVGSHVVVVDDVVTTGSSALEAVEYLQDQEEIEVNYLLTVVYRGTKEEALNFKKKHGVELEYIFLESDFY